jgi:HD-like signal output (HDOD) protein
VFKFIRRKDRDPREELQELLGGFELPTFSSSMVDLLGLLRDPEIPMSDVASRVEMDPGLTVRVLGLINSAGFGLMTQVSNLQHAVSLLGRSRLESLVLTFAATDGIAVAMEGLDAVQFWGAAARRATLARVLAQHLHAGTQAEAFTAGLLQDIAVPVLASVRPDEYAGILKRLHSGDGVRLDLEEQEIFGFDHATVGALLAEDWGLPAYLVEAIGGHHAPTEAWTAEPAVRLVSLVNYWPENDGSESIRRVAQEEYAIENDLADEMITRSFSDAEQFAGMFGA